LAQFPFTGNYSAAPMIGGLQREEGNSMSVSSVGPSAFPAQATAVQSAPADSSHDGDSDDVAPAPVQAAPSPGTGQKVDVTA
jgi:hypothetical protein